MRCLQRRPADRDVLRIRVRSKANIADLPSRGAMKDLKAILDGAECLGQVRQITCKLPKLARWNDHAVTWLQKGLKEYRKRKRRET